MSRSRFGAIGVALSFVAIVSSQEASHEQSRLPSGPYALERRPVTPLRSGANMGDRTAAITTDTWTFLGPAPVVNGGYDSGHSSTGRIAGIAAHPTDANTIYIASAGGGVWKTTNGGSNWFPMTDGEVMQAMGAIAIAPSSPNVIYAGTGEGSISGDPMGKGILVSSDAGTTWTLSSGNGALDWMSLFQIVVHPTNPDIAYAAVGNKLSGPYPKTTGIFKTTDRGVTWNVTTTAVTTLCNFTSVQIDLSQPLTVYAAVGNDLGSLCPSNGAQNGIYKTLDGGANWSLLVNAPHSTLTGRSRIALSRSNPQVVYLATVKRSPLSELGALDKFLRSDDGGETFTDLTAGTPNYFGHQGTYDTTLIVDPLNAAIVYAGGGGGICQDLLQSTNSGVTWSAMSNCVVPGGGIHVDHHASAFDANGKYLDGGDGGIYRLNNSSPVEWADLNGNLSTIQFYGIALHPTDVDVAYGGTQDNGTEKYTGTLGWTRIDGGDGCFVRFSTTNVNRLYHTYGGLAYFFARSDDAGATWEGKVAGMTDIGDLQNFCSPFVVAPDNGDRVLYGARHVWETVTGGDSWTALGAAFNSNVHALAVAPSDSNVIYAAAFQNFGGDVLYVTTNHGTNWTPRPLPLNALIGDIQISPRDPATAYFVDSRYAGGSVDVIGGPDEYRGRVFKTTNSGMNWTDISGNLSPLPVWSIQADWNLPGRLFVGADDGVYVSNNDGSTWSRLGAGLPRVQVYQIELNQSLGIIGAATHGRGLWEIAVRSGFTDDPLLPGTSIKAAHISELRSRTDAFRASQGSAPWNWTDPSLVPGVTPIRAQHLLDVRAALAGGYSALGRALPLYTDTDLTNRPMKAVHLTDLRRTLGALESVSSPGIALFSLPFPVGAGLQGGPFKLRLDANPAGATVRLTSGSPGLALLSTSNTTAGAGSIDISLPAGTTETTYFIQGVPGVVGSATLTASASGFTNGTGIVNIVQPAVWMNGVPTSMTVAGGQRDFDVAVGVYSSDFGGFKGMPVRPGGSVTVTVSSSNGAVAHLFSLHCQSGEVICSEPVLPNSIYAFSYSVVPTAPGSTTVSVTAPGFIGTPPTQISGFGSGATVQVTITP